MSNNGIWAIDKAKKTWMLPRITYFQVAALTIISVCALLLGCTSSHAPSASVQFTDNYSDSSIDADGDGLFESLNIDIGVIVSEPGYYTVGATLSSSVTAVMREDIDGNQVWVYLEKGPQTVQLTFEGKYIRMSEIDGPYLLSDLWVTDIQNPSPAELREHLIDSRVEPYKTSRYEHTEFQEP